jgi:hypothetical protein
MRILGAVVLPSTALMAAFDPKIVGGGAIRPQVVRDQPIGNEAIFLQKFPHQFQRGMLVSLGLRFGDEQLLCRLDAEGKCGHGPAFDAFGPWWRVLAAGVDTEDNYDLFEVSAGGRISRKLAGCRGLIFHFPGGFDRALAGALGQDALVVAWLESMGTRFLAAMPLTPAALDAPRGGQ